MVASLAGCYPPNAMKFTKMHGIGNDYVYINGFEQDVPEPGRLAQRMANRHLGVGGDGLILVLPSKQADVRMRMFNADGSESEMCGNGVRCVAKFAYDRKLSAANPMRVETGRGVLTLHLQTRNEKVEQVTVDMGEPILELADIPVDKSKLAPAGHELEHEIVLPDGIKWQGSFVSMGNPHAVFYVRDVQSLDLARIGPLVERHGAFPRRINVHFVEIRGQNEVVMRTWERGSGITMACGTGACAVCVAGVRTGRTARDLLAHLPGGDLLLKWSDDDNHVYMTGPATEVFSGEWDDTAHADA